MVFDHRLMKRLAALFLFAFSAALPAQTTYSVMENTSYFGWMDQYSLDNSTYHFVGNEACVPTSSTNAMTYLQNYAPGYFGTVLTGTTYASWQATDALLITPAYMDTQPSDGTYYDHIPYAWTKYVIEDNGFNAVSFSGIFPSDYWGTGNYAKPAYMTDGNPTSSFFVNALGAGNATIFSILYNGGGGGHELLAAGLDWVDLNDDGIIEFSENASLYFVDPLDPATYDGDGQPVAGPKITEGHVWYNEAESELKLSYTQYSGSLPYSGTYDTVGATIDTVFAVSVPEPGVWGLVALGGILVVMRVAATRSGDKLAKKL